MARHKKREEHGPQRDWESRPASVQAVGPGESKGRAFRAGAVVLVLLAGLGAVLLVYRRDEPRPPITIADKADEARPEVADLLREASRVVDRLLERFPDSPDALDAVAWAHRRFGQTEEAVMYWERCLELDPARVSACYSLGLVAQAAGDLAKAADYFRKAAQLDPQSSRYSVAWAESLMNMGELDEAARVLEKDLQVHPKSVPSVILAGQVCVRLRQYEKARQYLETAIEMAPDYTSAYYGLGTACAKLGDQEKAKEYLDRFKVLKAQDEQRHRETLKTLDDVADVQEGLAAVYTTAGKVHLAHGDVATAEDHFLKAAQVRPDFAECRQVLAWLYQQQGRTDEALEQLAKLEAIAPGDPAVCLSLGERYTEMGEFEKAERAYQKLVEISPHQGGGYAALARLYLQANRKIPEAKTLAEKAVELEPAAPYYFMLALVCQRTGDGASSLAAIEEALARDPGNTEYRRFWEMIETQQADGARPSAP